MARPKPRSWCRIAGSNGYTLEFNDLDDDTATAVVVGTVTNKRHANVPLDRAQLERLHTWLGELLIDGKRG